MKKNLKKRIYTSIILFLLIYLIFILEEILIFTLLIVGVLSILEFSNIIKKIFTNTLYKLIFNIFFIFYISIFCLLFYVFSNSYNLKILIFSLLFSCIGSDIGGYVFGKLFKGPKLTKISPNKTISGALGSLLFSCTFITSIFYFLVNKFNFEILLIGLFTSVACQLGDLIFSYLKRKAKLKDTGHFLPGHGGVLDRLDGILLGIPVGFFIILVLN